MRYRNTVVCGDAKEVLADVPENTVHCIVTSPPYWQQREYGGDDELGSESTVDEYIERLTDIGAEIARVLRDDGSFFLNVGDTYVNKSRQFVPTRLAEALCDECGFLCRQDCVWYKDGRKPDPARDRRATAHEHVFHLTTTDSYFYDETVTGGDHESVFCVPTAQSTDSHMAVFSTEFVETVIEGAVPWQVCAVCGDPYQRTYKEVPRPFADPDRSQAKRARELFEDSDLTEDHVAAIRAAGLSDTGKAVTTEDGHGKNSDSVTRLASEAKDVLGGYYREFTMVKRVPEDWESSCEHDESTSPLICDPFCGTGTTLTVAEERGCDYLGIDCYEKYASMAVDNLATADLSSVMHN